jgi:hypothetical protein
MSRKYQEINDRNEKGARQGNILKGGKMNIIE